MNIEESAMKVVHDMLPRGATFRPEFYVEFAKRLLAELSKDAEPVIIESPNYHHEAMGCGLEDRNITDRYEAMQYGWDCAVERMLEQIPEEPIFTHPANTAEIENRVAEACARLCCSYFYHADDTAEDCFDNPHDAAKAIRSGKWREFL